LRAFGCLLVLVLAAGIALFIYRNALTQTGMPPQEQIDTVGVQLDLQAIARAEKIYLVSHGRYGTVEELAAERAIPFSGENRHGYSYSAEADGDQHFRITARPVDPAKTSWPTLAIDETMQVVQQP